MEGDLVILCPDSAWPQAVNAVLKRPESLGIRKLRWHCIADPLHDSSPRAAELLRAYLGKYSHAMIIRDFEGSGWEEQGVEAFRDAIQQQLTSIGWESSNCKVLIVEPELEAWLRMDSAHFHELLKEHARKNQDNIGDWKRHLGEALQRHGGKLPNGKPARPKEVFRSLLSVYGIPPTNALFYYLGERESLRGCSVPSFQEFTEFLRLHFPCSRP